MKTTYKKYRNEYLIADLELCLMKFYRERLSVYIRYKKFKRINLINAYIDRVDFINKKIYIGTKKISFDSILNIELKNC